MTQTIGFRLLAIVALLAVAVPWFASPAVSNAAEAPHWVNDLKYGSRGGGFYWDSGSGLVWTAERGWHTFSPVPARSVSPLWVNDLAYPSKGKGFYLDPATNQVWTAECEWHYFSRAGCKPLPPPPPPVTPTTTACNPNYTGACLDQPGDYDCAGGRGNGPNYTGRVYVVGVDVYGLDGDGDGIGCE